MIRNPVLALDFLIGGVSSRHAFGRDFRDLVDVHVHRHMLGPAYPTTLLETAISGGCRSV